MQIVVIDKSKPEVPIFYRMFLFMHNGRSIQKQQPSEEEEESSKLKLLGGHLHDALISVLFI